MIEDIPILEHFLWLECWSIRRINCTVHYSVNDIPIGILPTLLDQVTYIVLNLRFNLQVQLVSIVFVF